MTDRIEGALLRYRRVELGLSQRRLGAAVGVNGMTIQRLEDGSDTNDFPLGLVRSLAGVLAVEVAALLGGEPPTRSGEEADVQVVGRLISAHERPLPRHHLIEALEWDHDRLDTALTGLREALAATGQALQESTAGLDLRAAHDPGPVDERLAASVAADIGLSSQERRLLRQAVAGPLSHERQSVPAQQATANLRRLGLLVDAGDAHILSDDARFSLMLDP